MKNIKDKGKKKVNKENETTGKEKIGTVWMVFHLWYSLIAESNGIFFYKQRCGKAF